MAPWSSRAARQRNRISLSNPGFESYTKSASSRINSGGARHYTIDVVHRRSLASYVQDHALPFAKALAGRTLSKEAIVVSGKGSVPDRGWSWSQIEPWVGPWGDGLASL